jgi:cystathionine beta-lyase/cystathionine gamma-synthase
MSMESEERRWGDSTTALHTGYRPVPLDVTLLSIETLLQLMAQHRRNAEKAAAYLAEHPKVHGVNCPDLPSHPQHELARPGMPNGCGGTMSLEVDGGMEGASRPNESSRIMPIAVTFDTSRSVTGHPAPCTHRPMTQEVRETAVSATLWSACRGLGGCRRPDR